MIESSELDFKTLFLTLVLFQIVTVSNLSYFGILFEKPTLITINQIFVTFSVLIDVGIYISHYFYNHISNFIKAIENYEFFNIEENEDSEEVNKYDLNVDSKNNSFNENINENNNEKNIKHDLKNNSSNENNNENIDEKKNKYDENLNQTNEELNKYLSDEYNKAIENLMDLIQREISKNDV